MKKFMTASSVMTLSAILCASNALAIEPATVPMGAVDLVPTLGLEQGYNDNLILQPTDGDVIGTQYTVLTPALQAILSNNTSEYTLGAQVIRGIHDRSSIDNYTDFRLDAGAAWMLNSRNKLELNAGYFDTHEARGTGFSKGLAASLLPPEEYENRTYGAAYTYGSEASKGRLVFDLARAEKEYSTNTAVTRYRDIDTDTIGATFFWQVGSRTDALVEVSQADGDYVNELTSTASLDNKYRKALVGVTWEATSKTEGTVKVGRAEKDFRDASRKDFKGTTWAVDASWSPLTYSTLSLTSTREAKDPSGDGNYIDVKSVGVNWQHGWNDVVSSNLYYNNADEKYKGDSLNRVDDITGYGITFDYQVRRWMSVGVSFGYNERDSNHAQFKYEQNITALNVQLSL